jgi:hypothetical protein
LDNSTVHTHIFLSLLLRISYSNIVDMSTEEAATDALQTPLDNNAEAADDVKKMLAELKGGSDVQDPEKTNGVSEKVNGTSDAKAENSEETEKTEAKDEDKENDDRHPDRRHRDEDDPPRYRRDRDDRGGPRHKGGRGGRGGGRSDFKPRNRRDNIKSNLVQEEESDDPVAIRKQVMRSPSATLRLF